MLKGPILNIVILLQVLPVVAQKQSGKVISNYCSRQFLIKDGLPQIQCTEIFEDSKKQIWVGTKQGVARWDGDMFTPVKLPNRKRMPQVTRIDELPDHTLAVGHLDNTIQLIKDNISTELLLPNSLSGVHIDSFRVRYAGMIFKDQSNGYFLFEKITENSKTTAKKKEVIITRYSLADNKLYSFASGEGTTATMNSDGEVLVVDDEDPANFRVQQIVQGKKSKIYAVGKFSANVIRKWSQNSKFNYVDRRRDSIYNFEFEFSNGSPAIRQAAIMPQKDAAFIVRERLIGFPDRTIFMNTRNEICMYFQGRFTVISSNNSIMSYALYDSEGNLWITSEQGVYCYYNLFMREYYFGFDNMKYDYIWSMSKVNGIFYLNTYTQGIFSSREHIGTWSKVPYFENDLKKNNNGMIRPGALGTRRTSTNGIIIPFGGGFYYLKDQIRRTVLLQNSVDIFDIAEDTTRNIIYISSYHAIYKYDELSARLDTFCTSDTMDNILKIDLDRDNNLIAAGKQGVRIFKDGRWVEITKKSTYTCATDANNTTWIFTLEGDIYTYKNDSLKLVDAKITNYMIQDSRLYDKNKLLVGTNRELIIIDLEKFYQTGKISHIKIDGSNGLNILEGGQNAFFIDPADSTVWWPCSDKLIQFDPRRIKAGKSIVSPVIRGVYAANNLKTFDADTVYGITRIEIPAEFRKMTFRYSIPTLVQTNDIVYRYRLKGFDDEWTKTLKQEVYYPKLPPGEYIFEVQATMDINTDEWSPPAYSKEISFNPYWYEKTTAIIIFVLTGMFFLVWLYFRREKRKLAVQKEKNELELEIARLQLNPHFLSNTLSSFQRLAIERTDRKELVNNIGALSRLYSLFLNSSVQGKIQMVNEIELLNSYLQVQNLRFTDRFTYSINTDARLPDDLYLMPMVIQPFVENCTESAFPDRSREGIISINFKYQNEHSFIVEIIDNGIGRQKAAANTRSGHTSNSTQIINRLIKLSKRFYSLNFKKRSSKFMPSNITITDLHQDLTIAVGTKVVIVFSLK